MRGQKRWSRSADVRCWKSRLTRLRDYGIEEVIVNVHHFADMMVDYLNAKHNFGMRIEISREEELLDTGGGLKKAAWFFQEGRQRTSRSFCITSM